jgi:hypothetical protein
MTPDPAARPRPSSPDGIPNWPSRWRLAELPDGGLRVELRWSDWPRWATVLVFGAVLPLGWLFLWTLSRQLVAAQRGFEHWFTWLVIMALLAGSVLALNELLNALANIGADWLLYPNHLEIRDRFLGIPRRRVYRDGRLRLLRQMPIGPLILVTTAPPLRKKVFPPARMFPRRGEAETLFDLAKARTGWTGDVV